MTDSHTLSGIVAYPITPFTDDNEINIPALHQLLDRMLDAGVNALAPLGSTGESAYLSESEWDRVASETLAHTANRAPTVVGASALTTDTTVRRARLAERLGATAIMVLPTSYWRLNEDELRQHFSTVAGSVDIPVMVYNNPGTTGIDMTPEFLFDLYSSIDNITMVKESTGDISRLHRLNELSGGALPVFNGSNPLAYRALSNGAIGWCTAAPALVPGPVMRFYDVVREGRADVAQAMLAYLQPLLELIVGRGLPATIKSGLASLGYDVGVPRRPLLPLSHGESKRLLELIIDCETNI